VFFAIDAPPLDSYVLSINTLAIEKIKKYMRKNVKNYIKSFIAP